MRLVFITKEELLHLLTSAAESLLNSSLLRTNVVTHGIKILVTLFS
jgi:hypothetical protein